MSESSDQSAMLKEILESVKALAVDQTRLRSDVDAIVGRVNILAGIKEVHDVAAKEETTNGSPKAAPVKQEPLDESVPESPSLPTTNSGHIEESIAALALSKKPSVTSRIILTWVIVSICFSLLCQPYMLRVVIKTTTSLSAVVFDCENLN